jgi:hypothetical protein
MGHKRLSAAAAITPHNTHLHTPGQLQMHNTAKHFVVELTSWLPVMGQKRLLAERLPEHTTLTLS